MTNPNISRIMIVGACARAAAQSAHQAGYQVITADLFADSDTCQVANCESLLDYPHEIPKFVSKYAPDAVFITGALENYPSILRRISNISRLLAPPISTITSIRSPFQLKATLQAAGFDFPGITDDQVPNYGKWIAKPYLSAAGHHIHVVTTGTECPAGYYLQEFVPGRPMSVSYLLQSNTITILGTSELMQGDVAAEEAFQFYGAITCSLADHHRLLLELGNLLRKIGLRGLTGVDFILTDENHIIILEVNPRYTATMELYEHLWKQPLIALHVAAFQDTDMAAAAAASLKVAGKQIIYAKQSVMITKRLMSQFHNTAADQDLELADIPHPGTSITRGHPILTLFGTALDVDSLKQRLRIGATSILQHTLD